MIHPVSTCFCASYNILRVHDFWELNALFVKKNSSFCFLSRPLNCKKDYKVGEGYIVSYTYPNQYSSWIYLFAARNDLHVPVLIKNPWRALFTSQVGDETVPGRFGLINRAGRARSRTTASIITRRACRRCPFHSSGAPLTSEHPGLWNNRHLFFSLFFFSLSPNGVVHTAQADSRWTT